MSGKRESDRTSRSKVLGPRSKGNGVDLGPRTEGPGPICACGAHDDDAHKATGVDPEIKDRNLKRLRRIEGQVRGLQKMVEEERYCADVLTQLSSVHEALRGVAREVMRNHLKHCAATAIRSGDEGAEEMYDELLELFYTHAR
jgi:CsoR family transcriptional regulator, copper-sensing transcriptional repressor